MNEKSIKRLRRKIILTVMLSLFLVMVFMGVTINAVSYFSSHRVIKQTTTESRLWQSLLMMTMTASEAAISI